MNAEDLAKGSGPCAYIYTFSAPLRSADKGGERKEHQGVDHEFCWRYCTIDDAW